MIFHAQKLTIAQKLIGLLMLFVATFVFIYYTTWVMLMPFVDKVSILSITASD
jgi:dolichyl-phosphate mannosyltransferase polypeptide 2 regulatory subunit